MDLLPDRLPFVFNFHSVSKNWGNSRYLLLSASSIVVSVLCSEVTHTVHHGLTCNFTKSFKALFLGSPELLLVCSVEGRPGNVCLASVVWKNWEFHSTAHSPLCEFKYIFSSSRWFVIPPDPDIPQGGALLWDTVKICKLQVWLMPNDWTKEAAQGLVPSVQVIGSLWQARKWPISLSWDHSWLSVCSCPTLKGVLVGSC